MSLILPHLQPRLIPFLHHKPTSIYPNLKPLAFSAKPKTKFQSNPSVSRSNTRFRRTYVPKSASVNGFPLQSDSEVSPRDVGVNNAELSEKLRRWIAFVRSVLPGGSWWSFSEDVDVVLTAKPVTVLRALQRMWELIAKDRWIIFAAFATLIITALAEISIPHFLTASIFSAQSGQIVVFQRNVHLLILLCVTAAICSGLRGCCFGIANMILVKRMRETLYSALLYQDISFFDSETVGDLTSRLGADCQQVSRVIGNDLNMILRNALQGTGALIYLLILSWPLGLCTLAICCILSAIMLLYGKYQKKAAKLTQEFTASANEVAQETFSLMRTIRVYGTEKQELGRYKHWLGKLADISLRQSAAYGLWNLSFNSLYHSTQVIAVLIGGMSILHGKITAEQLTKFILYGEWLIFSTWWIGDSFSSLMQSVGASEKVFQLMDFLPSDQFLAQGLKLPELRGHIEFVNVSFHYPSRAMVPVLKNLNVSVHPNEVVAIVGLSGSGKSTLVNLLLRLYEPTSGQILIDGLPLKDLDIKWLRQRVGYVGQEPRLFRLDVSSNIRYGCVRCITQEDVEWAAKQAYAHDFILSLPNGYQTIVDDDLLSGGQKQRIAIARAVLRDPNILILDEATSALDAESEHNVKGVLRAVRSDRKTQRAVIIIAHRLSTIQAADRIVVMDGGQIVEMGDHIELLTKNGMYARLTKRQADAVA
ncbi:ABC transporter B family member 26, chloroplastic [Rhododendron vialii]|uniref:ABC transporter B family member 26, chloroplastic n=1 Tax=Rhododendron vialii TaxID=182163 RepID=UPI00265FC51D|nr:ABC transporter B family member 26, chloroplastic [Rhododendron vialii]XP_058194020.1 ABC transporter B family member 26, chloroplastic [Rhododendron vialii]